MNCIEPISYSLRVPVEPAQAFGFFVDEIARWWPRDNTFAGVQGDQSLVETIAIEPHVGGNWFEQQRNGRRLSWGDVRVCDPPHRLVLGWQITPRGLPEPDHRKASTVELNFRQEASEKTIVHLQHRDLERHGDDSGRAWRTAMASDEGWKKLLECYAERLTESKR